MCNRTFMMTLVCTLSQVCTVQSGMRVGNNARFHCFVVVAYWVNCQQLTNEI